MHKRERGKENDKQINARGKERKIKNSRKKRRNDRAEESKNAAKKENFQRG